MTIRVGLLVGAVMVGMLAGPVTLAHAEPVSAKNDSVIPIEWEGETINLSWKGDQYVTAQGSVIGAPVSVPGDRAERTVLVRNAGPSAAVAKIDILQVSAENPDGSVNQELEDLLHLFWDVEGITGDAVWREARSHRDAEGVSYGFCLSVSQGQSFRIKAGYYFPVEATSGRNLGFVSSILSFGIRITMSDEDIAGPACPAPPQPPLTPAMPYAPTGGRSEGLTDDTTASGAVLVIIAGVSTLVAATMMRRQASVAQR